MPRDGAITFDDLRSRLPMLRVVCGKCGRAGRYSVERLIDRRSCDGTAVDFLADLSTDVLGGLPTPSMISATRIARIFRE